MHLLRTSLPAVGAGLSLAVIFVVVLAVPLGVADDLGLTTPQLTGWIMAGYGVPGVLSIALVLRKRQPLLLTGNMFIWLFVASLGGRLSWPELTAASMVAGVVVLGLGLLGLTDRLAAWLPAPIVYGVLAGAVLPFFVGLFTAFEGAHLIVGGALAAYLIGRRFLEPRVPAVLPALVAGLVIAGLAGDIAASPQENPWPTPAATLPVFSLGAILTAAPVMVVLITLQANVPSVVFLRAQGYRPPERTITVTSGIGTILASLFGPIGISLSLPATAIAAGPDAGGHAIRHRAAYLASAAGVLIALLAGLTADLATMVPRTLLLAMVGLAVVSVLGGALRQVASGPLVLGPLFAFGIALSDVSLLGLGAFFWALVVGYAVSLLLERDAWASLTADDPPAPSEPG